MGVCFLPHLFVLMFLFYCCLLDEKEFLLVFFVLFSVDILVVFCYLCCDALDITMCNFNILLSTFK